VGEEAARVAVCDSRANLAPRFLLAVAPTTEFDPLEPRKITSDAERSAPRWTAYGGRLAPSLEILLALRNREIAVEFVVCPRPNDIAFHDPIGYELGG
jgi:hypothetical protein